jgi:hypothetical protein
LKDTDPETYNIIQNEYKRQFQGLELIASEVKDSHILESSLVVELYFICSKRSPWKLHDKQIF